MKIADFSASLIPATALKQAGYGGVVLYCAPGRDSWMKAKQPNAAYLKELEANGIKFAFVWQYRKGGSMSVGDAVRGYDGGYEDASNALKYLNSVNQFNVPVFFAVDWPVTLDEWNSTVVNYFRGAVAKLGRERVGIYGHSRVIHWAMEDNVVAQVAPGRVLGWQTSSWSAGVKATDYAVLYQHSHGVPGPAGVEIDINESWHSEWGHRALKDYRADTPHKVMELAPVEYPCDMTIDTPDSGWRDPKATQATVFHTTENGDSTPPENVANWQTNPANSSSYNILIGADATGAKTIRTNPDNRRSWSAGEPGNTNAIHASAVGWAARSEADWFRNPKQLEQFARIAADHHLRYGRPLVWLEPADLQAGKKGFTSHGNWYHGRGGPAYRSDPGDGFPHDWVLDRAKEIISERIDMSFTDADRKMLREVHHELTHRFDSRYDLERLRRGEITERQVYKDTQIGYALEGDRKVEDIHANMMPAIFEGITEIKESLEKEGK